MFEITPKEQLLKNIRKGLVQPLPNKYPLLNLEKELLKQALLKTDESFIKNWVEDGFNFSVYKGHYDLLHQLRATCANYKLGIMSTDDKTLVNLFNDNDIQYLPLEKMEKTIACSFSKLEISTNTLYFSSEFQPIKAFHKAENILLFGKANQIESPDNNKYFSEITIKSDIKVQLPISYFKQFKQVFLFIEE